MYLGKTVEHGSKRDIFKRPLHPYTKALLASTPRIDPAQRQRKIILSGELPSPLAPPPGCAFNNRCPHASAHCRQQVPPLYIFEGRQVACHRIAEIS
jgi:dipeptide transport system ATP-binding protein